MRLFAPLLVSGLLLTTSLFAAAPSTNALQVTKPIYQWKTESANDKDGFNHCLVKNMYDNGTMMILAENREHIIRLALHFPQDKMQPNQQFDLTIQVDKRDVFPVEAAAVSPQVLTIGIPDTLPDQMKRGNALYLRGPKDEVIFTLDGMNGAVEALRDCVATNLAAPDTVKMAKSGKAKKNLVPDDLLDAPPPEMPKDPYDVTAYDETAELPQEESRSSSEVVAQTKSKNPIAAFVDKLKGDGEDKREIKVAENAVKPVIAQPEEKKPAPAIKAEEKKPEPKKAVEKKPEPKPVAAAKPPAPKAVEPKQEETIKPAPLLPAPYGDVIQAANLTPESLLMGRAGEKGNKPLDYAWIKGDLFIGLKKQILLPNPSVRLPQLMSGYMQMLKSRCAGEFVAEASAYTAARKGGYIVVEAACAPQGGDDTIAALLFVADEKQTTIYFVESPGEQGAAAIKARNAILNAAVK